MRQEVTDLIIEFIEKNQCLPFHKEWDVSKCPTTIRPHNPVTGTVYPGQNSVISSCSPGAIATGDYQFRTFAQAVDKDGKFVRVRSHFPSFTTTPSKRRMKTASGMITDPDRPANRMMGFLKGYRVFSRCDNEGMLGEEQPTIDPVT